MSYDMENIFCDLYASHFDVLPNSTQQFNSSCCRNMIDHVVLLFSGFFLASCTRQDGTAEVGVGIIEDRDPSGSMWCLTHTNSQMV